jgi:hypothetical protein
MTQASNSSGSSSPARTLWRIEYAGAATAVGSSAWQSAASWVGLQKRFRKNTVPGLGDVPVTLAPCPEVAGRWPEETTQNRAVNPLSPPRAAQLAPQRIARLLGSALVDLFAGVNNPRSQSSTASAAPATAPATTSAPWPQMVLLAVPAWLSAEQAQTVWQQSLGLLQQQGGAAQARALSQLSWQVVRSGQTASFEALEQMSRSGHGLTDVLLLAADSWMDLALLQPELAANRLLTDKNQDGFIAGEAAAALWLHRVPDTTAFDEQHLVLHSPALARSAHAHRDPLREPNPEALAQVFRSALSHAGWKPEHVGNKLSDSDGSAWRATAEMGATARALKGQDPDEWQPATVLGQVGAATGAVHWALAAQRLRHDKTAPNSLLSWALDAGELTAAVAMERTIYNDETLAAIEQENRLRRRSHSDTVKTFSARFLNKTS